MTEHLDTENVVKSLMIGAVPERRDDIELLWRKYDPDVLIVENAKRITLNANKDRIAFDSKTVEVFWLIGFGGWKAIECYSPLVVLSHSTGTEIADVIEEDDELADVERDYKERRAAAQTIIDAENVDEYRWPPDLPKPTPDRNAIEDVQFKAAFDLTLSAIGFTLFHEFRHVMLDVDNERHTDRREEELACDVWAREFMTAKISTYARASGHEFNKVLLRRSMAFALAALIIHEITPVLDHGGNRQYFSVATRLQTILENTALPADNSFWIFSASLLIGILRQKGVTIDVPVLSPKELTRHFITRL